MKSVVVVIGIFPYFSVELRIQHNATAKKPEEKAKTCTQFSM